ncbi:hypothetical protein D6833_03265, partial [Candidatus Parcubacteria bacterium]
MPMDRGCMKPTIPCYACLLVLTYPRLLLACGGCTDAVLLMTLPWAGFGGLFLWAWVFTMLGLRGHFGRRGEENAQAMVRGSTLAIFALLGSVGYVALAFLTMGSWLLPSLVVGFAWAVYVTIRLAVDVFGVVFRKNLQLRARLLCHGLFLVAVVVVVVYFQIKANTLEHCIACLGYGHHSVMYSKVMPKIVAHGEDSIAPLIQATNKAMANDDPYARSNVVVHATFCLAQIGGPEAEQFLAGLLKRYREPDDFGYRRGYKAVHFAYARCAGPRAVNDLIRVFEEMPPGAEQDERWIPLVALLVTGSRRGVEFVLDHMDLLLDRMEHGVDGNETRVLQAALGRLVFGTDPQALKEIPVYRDVAL